MSLAVLHELEESLDGEISLCQGFVATFISMWGPRFDRLSMAIAEQDTDRAMDAALSICTASHMAGAQQLNLLTLDLIQVLKSSQPNQATMALPTLGHCGEQTMGELSRCYLKPQ